MAHLWFYASYFALGTSPVAYALMMAALNAVAQYLAGYTDVGEPVESAAISDPVVDPDSEGGV